MKFVCLNCETYMTFQKVEKPGEGSLNVCSSAVHPLRSQVFDGDEPGETQMVASLASSSEVEQRPQSHSE